MKSNFFVIILIVVSVILSIISFGLTSGIGIGFSNPDRILYHDVSTLIALLDIQNAANTANMSEASWINNNITIDIYALPELKHCEETNREDIGPVVELAQQRYNELSHYDVIFTYNLSAVNASVYATLEAMNSTGLITIYSSEQAEPWNYTVEGLTLQSDISLYYLGFQRFQTIENQTQLILGLNLTGDGYLPIYDDQTLKLANAPSFIRFTERAFSMSEGLQLSSDGSINFLEILNKIEMSF